MSIKVPCWYTRLITILFPELQHLVPTLHLSSVYAKRLELPGSDAIAACHLTRLTHLLRERSKGHYGKATATMLRDAARVSIGSHNTAKSLELQQTICLIA